MNLLFVKPFWALDKTMSLIFFNLLSTAFDTTLKTQFNKDIGRQFFIFSTSPFLGISLIIALLKDCDRVCFCMQQETHLCNGILIYVQNFF
jgi:hypothetical protein